MKYNNDTKKRITSAGLIVTMFLLCACSNNSSTQTSMMETSSTTYETNYDEIQNTENQTTVATDNSEVTESSETEPVFTYETTIVHHETDYCSLLPYIFDCYMYPHPSRALSLVGLGMDNPYLQSQINEVLYQNTGTYYDVTIDDVAYLSYSTPLFGSTDSRILSREFGGFIESRIILSRLGLRFGIDEIPWWFIEQNFGDIIQGYIDGTINCQELGHNLQGFPRYEQYQQEISIRINILTSILEYNDFRAALVTDEQSALGKVQIVRDTITGNIILVPTTEQYNMINNMLNNLDSFSNMDIYQVESEENIFSDVGVDPSQYPSTMAYFDSLNYTK